MSQDTPYCIYGPDIKFYHVLYGLEIIVSMIYIYILYLYGLEIPRSFKIPKNRCYLLTMENHIQPCSTCTTQPVQGLIQISKYWLVLVEYMCPLMAVIPKSKMLSPLQQKVYCCWNPLALEDMSNRLHLEWFPFPKTQAYQRNLVVYDMSSDFYFGYLGLQDTLNCVGSSGVRWHHKQIVNIAQNGHPHWSPVWILAVLTRGYIMSFMRNSDGDIYPY